LSNDTQELSHTLHPFDYLFNLRPQVGCLAVVHSPVIGEQVLWLDLQQSLKDTLGPHICAAAREQATQAHNGHETDEGVEARARNYGHSVALLDAAIPHGVAQQADLPPHLTPSHVPNLRIPLPHLRHGNRLILFIHFRGLARIRRIRRKENVLGEIEIRAAKPVGYAVHGSRSIYHLLVGARVYESRGLPHIFPEIRAVGADAPIVQLAVRLHVQTMLLVRVLHKFIHGG